MNLGFGYKANYDALHAKFKYKYNFLTLNEQKLE